MSSPESVPGASAPAAASEAAGFNHTPEAKRLIDALKTLYTTTDTKLQDATIEEHYSPSASFIDPIAHVSGHPDIKTQFHALARMLKFVTWDALESKVEDSKKAIKIENKQSYGVGLTTLRFDVITTLVLDDTGKIESHTDVWHNWWGGIDIFKRILGSTMSIVMRLLRI